MRNLLIIALLAVIPSQSLGSEYYRVKIGDIPDPTTLPRMSENGCAQEACTKIPEFRDLRVTFKNQCHCVLPRLPKTELLRKDVFFVISGPANAEEAVKVAARRIAEGCAAVSLPAAKAAFVAAPSPELTARTAAALGAFLATFKGCILSVSAAGAIAEIKNQFSVGPEFGSHWAPL